MRAAGPFVVVEQPPGTAFTRRRPSGHKVRLPFEVHDKDGEVAGAFQSRTRADAYAWQLNKSMRKRSCTQ